MAGQLTAVEDPVRVAAEQGRERGREEGAVEPEVDADDRRVLELRLRGWNGEHDGVGVEAVRVVHADAGLDRRTRGFERSAGRVAVYFAERTGREHEVGIAPLAEERGADGE